MSRAAVAVLGLLVVLVVASLAAVLLGGPGSPPAPVKDGRLVVLEFSDFG